MADKLYQCMKELAKKDSETVARYRETIDILLRKAKEKWKLE